VRLALVDLDGERFLATVGSGTVGLVGPGGQDEILALAMSGSAPTVADTVPVDRVRFLAPIPRPPSFRDFFAFEQHVAAAAGERGIDPGWYAQPLFYFSNPAAIIGPDDEVAPPTGCRAFDFELEFACVIGREASDLDPNDPKTMDVVAGFTILNDWSARDIQAVEMKQNLGVTKGKDFATSIGPYLVTSDDLPGAADGRPAATMTARVNGREVSRANTSEIYFSWPQILAHASANTRLMPGDVIGSGTCGTGCILEWRVTGHRDEYAWIKPGDTVELEIDGLGILRNPVVARA
jgi:fumarylacetoacetate (FAA) hydrolase